MQTSSYSEALWERARAVRLTWLSDEAIRGLLICLGLLGLAVGGAVFRAREDWKALRHKLFRRDEDQERLGEQVVLPPFLEPRRAEIVANLTPID